MPLCAAFRCTYAVKDNKEHCVSLHSFPKDKIWRKKWENACGRVRLPKEPRLCSRHFSPDAFESFGRAQLVKELTGAAGGYRTSLKPDAVPTIFPHKESVKQEEPEDQPDMNILHMVVYCKEEGSAEQERSPSLLQEEPEHRHPHIKEETEEPEPLHIKDEKEEILIRPEEPDESTLTLLAVKSEADNEDVSSHCSEIEVELESDSEVTEDSDDWEEETSGGVRSQTLTFSCPECQYSYASQIFLHKHIEQSHSDLFRQMLRNGLIIRAARQKISNSVTQTGGEKRFPCTQCDKSFSWLSELRRHQLIHTGEKPFNCTQCDKRFNRGWGLRQHLRIHTEKPFHCTQCNNSFCTPASLERHEWVHTVYHCKHCDKSFSHAGDLHIHQHIHM